MYSDRGKTEKIKIHLQAQTDFMVCCCPQRVDSKLAAAQSFMLLAIILQATEHRSRQGL